jgi:hypothetical protein
MKRPSSLDVSYPYRGAGMRAKLVSIFVLAMLLPLMPSALDPLPAVEAASNCSGEIPSVRWNETVSRVAITPSSSNDWYYEDWEGDNRRRGGDDMSSQPFEDTVIIDDTEEPEESWMKNNNFWTLEPLQENIRATMVIGNNSVGAYVVNLSSSHRSTFCVTLQGLDNGNYSAVKGDVYLLTSTEWDRYTTTYGQSFSNYYDEMGATSDIPPEWRSFNILGWDTYRDSHLYESIDEVTFSVSLDGPEVHSNLWGDSQWEQFYVVVDTWDNDHQNDAPSPGVVTVADVTIIVEERGTVLPNWTVSLTCMSTMIAVLITPFVMNRKYMGAGLEINQTGDAAKLMPSLEQEKS